jgi:hypothetical protein
MLHVLGVILRVVYQGSRSMLTNNRCAKLALAYWNVDGLHKRIDGHRVCKLDDVDLQSQLNVYDIICLVETHCGKDTVLQLPGYQIFRNTRERSQNAKRDYGGIAICIKTLIRDGVKILPTTSSEVMWIKLSKSFFNLERDIYLAAVYVSPESSPYSGKNDNVFEIVENQVAQYSDLGSCFVCGDFNARTSREPDYCADDNSPIADLCSDYITDLPIDRNNSDPHQVNNYGKQLLSLCKTAGLRILNGRSLGDYFGHCTCYSHTGQPSVIDYMLASVNMLSSVDHFHVHDPNDISIHCMLSTTLSTGYFHTVQTNVPVNQQRKYLWSNVDSQKFISAISAPDVVSRVHSLLLSDSSNSTVDNVISELSEIITNAADKAGIRQKRAVTNKAPKKKKRNKNWYDRDCKSMRRQLKTDGRRLHRNPFDPNLLNKFRYSRKMFKKLLNRKKKDYKQGILGQLESLQSNNPKVYWNLFKKLRELDRSHTSHNPISDSEWVNHFTKLLNEIPSTIDPLMNIHMDNFIQMNTESTFNELNFTISAIEIASAISKLKNGKASGSDSILNEMLKAGQSQLIPILHKVFNLILSAGEFPEAWRLNILTPIHKKGDTFVPSNYRGIAVGSNLCKLFCSILHERLVNFVKTRDIIPKGQIGYQKGCSTADHILTLKAIVEKYVNKASKAHLFCCFVDFRSAFDTISRRALIYKLIQVGVGGNFIKVLESMYSAVLYSVRTGDALSQSITSTVGVKQGCVLSPLLFNIFVSDLPIIFKEDCDPITLHDTEISCLMFADDLVLVSRTRSGLQSALNYLHSYCTKWGLVVNLSKTKVLIFNKGGKLIKSCQFVLNNQQLENVSSYCYLGIVFSASGLFKAACERLSDQALKALFKLRTIDIRNNFTTAIKLFNSLVMPILRYCSEIWSPYYISGISTNNLVNICENVPSEKVLIRFFKYLLGVNKKATNAAVRGELGEYPLLTGLLSQTGKYWLRLCALDPSALVHKAYLDSYSNMKPGLINWASCIKTLWTHFDLQDTWDNQGSLFKHKSISLLQQAITKKYEIGWSRVINNNDGSKLRTYSIFKQEFALENYILAEPNVAKRKEFTKLRISAHRLRIETDRYCRPKILAELRTCKLCESGEVEDEQHFICRCKCFDNDRAILYHELSQFSIFDSLDEHEKFVFIMSYGNGDTSILKHVIKFINLVTEKRQSYS